MVNRKILLVVFFCVVIHGEFVGEPVGFLPSCPGSEKKVEIPKRMLSNLHFILQYSKGNRTVRKPYTYFKAVSGISTNPAYDINRKTILFVSGFLDSTNFPIAWTIGLHYNNLNYNVILLDTNRFTTYPYPIASRLTRAVGKHAAEVLGNLTDVGLRPTDIEILGLSLGGQTVSFIGKNYYKLTGRKLSRITALDPAGPCFRNLGSNDRLDSADAEFVDVINTNIDGYGFASPVGHVNFYVNGGEYQPGLSELLPCTIMCSHMRAFLLWLSALNNQDKFLAIKCKSVQQAREHNCYANIPLVTNVMGLKTNKSNHGIFYLATDNIYPYHLGDMGIKREYEIFTRKLASYNKDDIFL